MAKSLIIDIETLDNKPTAVILDIAAALFDIDERNTFDELVTNESNLFYRKIDAMNQPGRTVGLSTLDWWEKQDPVVKKILKRSQDDVSLHAALADLKRFLDANNFDYKNGLAYVRGASFDFPILASALDTNHDSFGFGYSSFPVNFWNQRDVRTALAFAMVKPDLRKMPMVKGQFANFNKHNAIHDICKDIILLQAAVRYAKTGESELDGQDLEAV
jgi:hypothetical protein